jgi:hypothetical protein
MTTETQAEFARRIGVDRSRVTHLKGAGRLVMEGNKVNVEASTARIESTKSPAHDAQEKIGAGRTAYEAPTQDDRIGNNYQAARAVKERYLALEAKRAYEVACGQLMRAEEVSAMAADAATTLRTRLETLPDQLAAQMGGHLDESQRRAVAADIIESILAGLSGDFAKLAKDAHAPA